MDPPDLLSWDAALGRMLRRWRLILGKIDARDEGAVLTLANMLDEFCELAVSERRRVAGDRHDPAVPVLKFAPDADVSGRCAFCRAFATLGGCFRPLHDLNRAILDHEWEVARKVAEAHLERLRNLKFTRAGGETIH